MKKLLLLACLFCAPAFAESPEELAVAAKAVIELRLCPGGATTVLIYVFNEEGNRIVLGDEELKVEFNQQFLGAVLARKNVRHEVFYLCGVGS